MDAVVTLQLVSATLLNASFAWMVGSLYAEFWLGESNTKNHFQVCAVLHRSGVVAAILCLLASSAALWAGAAVMSGTTLAAAVDMLGLMLTKTAYGKDGLIGLVLLILSILFFTLSGKFRLLRHALVILLGAFALSRALVSHSGGQGLFSLSLLVEWLHLVSIAVWVGGVAIAAWVVLPRARVSNLQTARLRAYLEQLSLAAMIALTCIVITGFYNAWHRLESMHDLLGNAYRTVLLVKLALVGLAVLLGGYNKFVGFPALICEPEKSHAMAVIRVESFLLLGSLIAASVLMSQQPPVSF